ncbi:response regulator [Halocella sp. SP3-1]|uniref:response regulator n=1 Tax=Halocella sp. SP3-1 TaxID=2382161 RepID=UPI000F75B593|nr:response regulator [Halocella sp. SP3-1]AZO96249.1 response regulator [Halocella sp. SP3-1]
MYRVMIVDDEPNIRNGLRNIIDWQKYNFTVCSVARNGKDAIEKMKSTYPDLIITDIKMPGLDGLGLIKYIRKSMYDKNMSFIILSGYDEFAYAKEAIKYNVSRYLLKPIDEEELIDIVEILAEELSQKNRFEFFYNRQVEEFSEEFNEIEEFGVLVNVICDNQKLRIKKTIKNMFNDFYQVYLHPRIIKIYLANFLLEISKIITNMGGSIESIVKKYNIFNTDISAYNLIQLENELREFSFEVAQFISELKQSCSIINKVKQYIKDNYFKEIKLKEIAKKFYINPAYLGQLFKKENGLNFSEYLSEIRLNNAKKLLRDTNLHVYQIAEKVGYKNSDYFIIKFKEKVDCTPMEYKNRHR